MLRFYRTRLGYTQKEVAAILGCARQQVVGYETGACVPNAVLTIGLAALYEQQPKALFPQLFQKMRGRLRRAGAVLTL